MSEQCFMRRRPRAFILFFIPWLLGAAAFISLLGCKDYGVGGTGELVVPREKFHDFNQLSLTTRPATEPATLASTQPAPLSIDLTIEQARRNALANNLDLRVELLDPTVANEALNAERAKFEATFTTDLGYNRSEAPTITPKIAGTEGKNYSFTPGLEIPLQTGGQITLQAPQDRSETNNPQADLNPAFTNTADASISLPLLRGFGPDANAQSIRIAFYNSQQAQARTKLEVIQVLTDVEKSYWQLYAARRELGVRQKQYDLAMAQLERARREVKAGTVAEVEIVRAESGVADSVQAIITAANEVATQQRDLKRIINRPDIPIESETAITPTTIPNATPYAMDSSRLVKISMNQRMELLEEEIQFATDTANVAAAKNAMLPLLSLNYDYSLDGLGSTYKRAWNQVGETEFKNQNFGLHLEIPIGNDAARSLYREALAQRLTTLATKEQRVAQITEDVCNAVDTLEAAWQSILAAQERTILNARLLEVEIRSFEQGLRTSTEVLNAQITLADAQSSEIAAITAYQIAQVNLAFATGTVLGQSEIDWEPTRAPRE